MLGDFVWTAIDYFGESAIGHSLLSVEPANWRQKYPWFISYCGDIDAVGHKKPQSYFRDVLWGQSKLEMAVQRPLPPGRTETLASWGWWTNCAVGRGLALTKNLSTCASIPRAIR